MAYDEELADRIRALLSERDDVSEKKMFGGLAFLLGGHMAVCASRVGGVMVRVDPDQYEKLLTTTKATAFEMRGREVTGWVRLAGDDVRTERQLAPWVTRGTTAAAALPPKKAVTRRKT